MTKPRRGIWRRMIRWSVIATAIAVVARLVGEALTKRDQAQPATDAGAPSGSSDGTRVAPAVMPDSTISETPDDAQAAPETPPQAPVDDDLQRIGGVGPAMEKALRAEGITTFRQMALFDDDDLASLELRQPRLAIRLRRDGWREQARQLHLEVHGSEL